MNTHKHLVEVVNSKGMTVQHVRTWLPNQFGETSIVTIEISTHRIIFITNVLHGVNYFKIIQVHDTQKNRVYRAQRYFHKYISLISSINGETYTSLNKKEDK